MVGAAVAYARLIISGKKLKRESQKKASLQIDGIEIHVAYQ